MLWGFNTVFLPGGRPYRLVIYLFAPPRRHGGIQPPTSPERPRRIGVSQQIAKRVGVSQATYERTKKIIEKGSDQQKNELRKGAVGIRAIDSCWS
ncbi:MAG: hypothetical protein WAM14_26130 [Candidatus Nitrosopolaris sp.]